ncbi:MAG: Flp family type IVb pilin [Micavibrio sp.]|nr:Flp family type IVb pilin [Micavibrio sp.]
MGKGLSLMFIRLSALHFAHLRPWLRGFVTYSKGATAIEYGLIAGGISIVIMVAVFAVGSDLRDMFGFMQSKMSSAGAKVK